ncbi:potassium channel family protein [Oceanicoccus sagamiensis]|uniref:Potassium channel domain-containing protein n=1 Tax=Oceanicoccus sagamiensis TaxID=716816 RepID=A0A1X9NER4_9GAMM|nr:potassium channel family protein [Oceanicoccus sagamiensis]ARN75544.1 hypothetical protein BST96_16370 [Oceanicoccus sagamiensis]
MTDKHFHNWIGLTGVDDSENARARQWAKRLEIPLLFVALWILVSWYWESTKHALPFTDQLNWSLWLFFVVETSLLTWLVDDKARYLKNNWLNLVIILCGIPVLWLQSPYIGVLRSLRLLIFLGLMLQLSRSVRTVLSRNHLGATLFVSLLFIIIAGYLIAGVDPNISSPADGIWWAWVTATTVGYGDIVPVSPAGRILGGFLILLGIGLFSMITANISVFFITKSKEAFYKERLSNIEDKLERIEQLLSQEKANPAQTSGSKDKLD